MEEKGMKTTLDARRSTRGTGETKTGAFKHCVSGRIGDPRIKIRCKKVSIPLEEYYRLKRIENAANFCIGWICGWKGRVNKELHESLMSVKQRLERATEK